MMDSQSHERVEISDYPGVPNVPPLATPAPQREIKQRDAAEPRQAVARHAIYIAPHITNEDNKLVVTKNTWGGIISRVGWVILALVFLLLYIFVFRNIGVILTIAALVAFIAELVRFSRDESHRIIFDRSADSVTEGAARIAHIREIGAVNLDKQPRSGRLPETWRVALLMGSGELIEIDHWYYKAEATHIASAIADYIGVSVEHTETPY